MFGALTQKFHQLISGLAGKKTLTESNISEAVREVRLALLEADVNYSVATQLVNRIKDKSMGDEVLRSVTPSQQFIKIIHDELVALMGSDEAELHTRGEPAVIMLCGLQGAGKTTQSAKLAAYLKKKDPSKKIMLAACDLQRPAAIEQLKTLGSQVGVPVYSDLSEKDPKVIAKAALRQAIADKIEILIVDTAGRLHIDEELMQQLQELKSILNPQEILFVASAAMGQDAVKTASEFDKRLAISGTILTMLDGSARAGAAISIREMTKKPLKFEGIGEKISDFQIFNPHSMADRILGMGDVINLVRKAEEHFDEEAEKDLEKKIRKASFTYDDYLKQMSAVKKMGSLKSLFKMMPGMSEMGDFDIDEKEFARLEAMILSMTPDERLEKVELMPSRRRRVASGSGCSVDDVNKLVKNFKRLKLMAKQLPQMKQKLQKEKSIWR